MKFSISNIFAVALPLRAALAGSVSCYVLVHNGISNVVIIDGVWCEAFWNQGSPACHVSFDNKITLHGGGNCEGTVYWFQNGQMHTKEANKWRQWCTPDPGSCGAAESICECTTGDHVQDRCTESECGYWDTALHAQGFLM